MSDNKADTSNIAKWMFFAAWIAILALLYIYFSGVLDKKYNPNQSPLSTQNGQQTEVQLLRNSRGHYVSSGFINGQELTFLLDTGATSVVVPAGLANQLGLRGGQVFNANTANGVVRVSRTNISNLSIGDINFKNVEGVINPGMSGQEILLGMSVLKHLELIQRGDILILRTPL